MYIATCIGLSNRIYVSHIEIFKNLLFKKSVHQQKIQLLI